ncbi:MAG: phosphomannomutase/phosphoglucomutase [Planctomycetes bacterium]|nr:phosphomannomutase/phosphoglucomutase [Planctomycetota bacterium]
MSEFDKVFKAYDVRGIYGPEINEDLAWKVGHAAGQFLRSQLSGFERGQATSNRLVVGRDMRPHSKSLADALIQGIASSGPNCVDVGMVDTPMVYFAVNHLGACGGIQVTASHNPVKYNGFKVCGFKAKPIGQTTGLNEIKHIASTLRKMPSGASQGSIREMDLWPDYRRHVLQFVRLPRRLKIVVDASNGMGGRMIPAIFESSDVEIIPLNFTMDGTFAHEPNPLIEENLKQVKQAVSRRKADFGICLDGDADRCVFIDEKGDSVRCDMMTALLARHFLKDNPGSMVVYDLRSSQVVAEEIKSAGGVPKRERVGHAFMKKALADGRGVFGGELSGHFYFRDNFNCDSGAIAFATVASIISGQNKKLSELVAPLMRYHASGEINFEIEDKEAKMKEIASKFPDAQTDWLDGVTCQYPDWWFNIRASNTEPLLRLNLEARTPQMMQDKLKQLEGMLGKRSAH